MVPREGFLRVLSIHQRAVNLQRCDARTLVSLISDARDMAPTALLLNRLPGGLDRGAVARLDRSSLTIGGERIVEYGGARCWNGSLPRGSGYRLTPERVGALRRLVTLHGRHGGLLGLLHPQACNPLSDFAHRKLAATVSATGAEADLSTLVGLGVGLTPSGDDFLVGAMLAEELCDRCGAAHRRLDRGALQRRLPATTAAGETLLCSALEHQFPAYLIQLADRVFHWSADNTFPERRSMAYLFDHGQTSGTDSAVGAVWFLSNLAADT